MSGDELMDRVKAKVDDQTEQLREMTGAKVEKQTEKLREMTGAKVDEQTELLRQLMGKVKVKIDGQTEQLQELNTKSVQTEQSAALEVEIDEQKTRIRQLMTRESDMKNYIQLMQHELDKRSSETVVKAAKMRELETQLSDGETSDLSSPPSQPAAETRYKREYFSAVPTLVSAANWSN